MTKNKKIKRNNKKNLNDLVQSIGSMTKSMQGLARQAEIQYSLEVEDIIASKNQDTNKIQLLLDYMLSFCFDDRVLLLYKKLCRYYLPIDPEGTVYYVNAYREMWDEESLKLEKSMNGRHERKSNG